VVRTYATSPGEAGNEHFTKLDSLKKGLNRVAWDYRTESVPAVEGLQTYGSLQGRRFPPGEYGVRLTEGDEVATASLRVLPDPRRTATPAQYVEQDRLLAAAQALVSDLYESVNGMRSVGAQVDAVVESTAGHASADTIAAVAEGLSGKIEAWEDALIQPDQRTFQDVINFLNRLDAQILALIESVDGTEPPVTQGAKERLRDLTSEWTGLARTRDAILDEDLAAFERLLEELGIPHVVISRAVPGRRPITQDALPGTG